MNTDGWTLAPGAVPPAVVDALNAAWDAEIRPFAGPLPRQLTSRAERHIWSDGRIVNPVMASSLLVDDFPMSGQAFGDLLRVPALWAATASWIQDPALLQIAWVESTEGTAWHQDHHPIRPDGQVIGVWVALEDIAPEAGPFRVITGSHLDNFAADWRVAARAAAHAQFVERSDPRGEAGAWLAHDVDAALRESGRAPVEILPSAGDVIVWDGRLIHGSRPPAPGTHRTRRSALIHLGTRTSSR